MFNNKLVNVVVASIILDLLTLIILVFSLNVLEDGVGYTFQVLTTFFNLLFRSVFFYVIFRYQRYQRPYMIIAITSWLSMFFYMIYVILVGRYGYSVFSISDLTLIAFIVNVAAAFYISIDDSVFNWVKIPFMIHAVYLLMFKTPLIIYTEFMVYRFFGYLAYAEYSIDLLLVIIQYLIYFVISIFFVRMVKKIDYM